MWSKYSHKISSAEATSSRTVDRRVRCVVLVECARGSSSGFEPQSESQSMGHFDHGGKTRVSVGDSRVGPAMHETPRECPHSSGPPAGQVIALVGIRLAAATAPYPFRRQYRPGTRGRRNPTPRAGTHPKTVHHRSILPLCNSSSLWCDQRGKMSR